MESLKGKPTIILILLSIVGILHVLIPAWGIIIPDIGASFYWYWGFYFAGSGGDTDSGTISDQAILTAGTTAMFLMFIGFGIFLITIILARALKASETDKLLTVFSIIWIIVGILLVIAPSIYLYSVKDVIFDKYSWGIGLYFSYGLGIVPLLLGIGFLVASLKK